jgi:hypothetical protein
LNELFDTFQVFHKASLTAGYCQDTVIYGMCSEEA